MPESPDGAYFGIDPGPDQDKSLKYKKIAIITGPKRGLRWHFGGGKGHLRIEKG